MVPYYDSFIQPDLKMRKRTKGTVRTMPQLNKSSPPSQPITWLRISSLSVKSMVFVEETMEVAKVYIPRHQSHQQLPHSRFSTGQHKAGDTQSYLIYQGHKRHHNQYPIDLLFTCDHSAIQYRVKSSPTQLNAWWVQAQTMGLRFTDLAQPRKYPHSLW